MTIHFDPLIKKKQAITYIDDTIMQSQNKNEMFTVINEYHTLLRKAGLKAAPDKTFFFLKKVKFLDHVISPDGIQTIGKRVKDLKTLKSPESKRDVMKVLGCLGFYSCYIKNLHVDSQPFYDLIKDSTPFHWTYEHQKIIPIDQGKNQRRYDPCGALYRLPVSHSCGLIKCSNWLYSNSTVS